jgi:hypothetical protein
VKIIATGSSTLSASAKFKDTLTGRKTVIHLPPMILEDVASFLLPDLSKRLLSGGLPPFSVQEKISGNEVQEWVDSYWALECKWKAEAFDPENLLIFRNRYPQGLNFVITADTPAPYQRKFKDVTVEFVGLSDAIKRFSGIE